MKWCTHCGRLKPLSDFYSYRGKVFGRCKVPCHRWASRQWWARKGNRRAAAKRKRTRYQTDPSYRAHVLEQNRAAHQRRAARRESA